MDLNELRDLDLERLSDDEVAQKWKEALDTDDPRMLSLFPWQYSSTSLNKYDPDIRGPIRTQSDKTDPRSTRETLQEICWQKATRNPQINTNIRGEVGRMTGHGFKTTSRVFEIREAIKEIENDPRNRLYLMWPKYVARSKIEGELFLVLTVHKDGFIEVDFIDPGAVNDPQISDGILVHPRKTRLPLFYCVNDGNDNIEQIPSIFIARYPEMVNVAKNIQGFNKSKQAITRKQAFQKFKGYYRFVVEWDKTWITTRNIGHLRTVIGWSNLWEMMKAYEIDHKKSSGSYLWTLKIDDMRMYLKWLALSDEDRAKTGITEKKTPGSMLVLGPSMSLQASYPQLQSISDSDSDIQKMILSGLNENQDTSMGELRSTFASAKASRGPASDRTSDEIALFQNFLIKDFWGSIFFLKSAVGQFPETFTIQEAVDFKNKEPVIKPVKRRPEELIEVRWPISETIDFEGRAKGLRGVKHGDLNKTMGISNTSISDKLGFNYFEERLQNATDEEQLPELAVPLDDETYQERTEGEPKKNPAKKKEVKA